MKWMSQISVLLSTVKSFFQGDLVENYVVNERLIEMRFLRKLSIETLGRFALYLEAEERPLSTYWSSIPISYAVFCVRLTCGLGFRVGRHGVGRRTSVHGRLSRPWGFWVWRWLARRRSAVIGLSTATTHRLTWVQETLKFSCNPWRLARSSSLYLQFYHKSTYW